MTLFRSGADNGAGARAGSALTGVGLRAGVPVVASGAVGLRGIRAHSRAWIAGAYVVTLVRSGADHGVAPDATPTLAGIGLCAKVAVVARVVVVREHATRGRAARIRRTSVAVVAGPVIRRMRAPGLDLVASIDGASDAVVAVRGCSGTTIEQHIAPLRAIAEQTVAVASRQVGEQAVREVCSFASRFS